MKETEAGLKNQNGIDWQKLRNGRYEAERLPRDFSPERIVPDFAFNVLNPLGLLYRPVVDEVYLADGVAKPVWPEGKPLAVCLTHDVDLVTLYSQRQVCRAGAQALRQAENWIQKTRAALAFGRDWAATSLRKGATDPLHCYERWLEVEAAFGARSTFFFWPGWSSVRRHHPSDCTYELTDQVVFDGQKCTVAEMIREIDHRGWEIGLHPSWYSFDNIDEMKRQKETLETALDHDVVSVRQHFLHYDIRVTPRIQAEAGLRYDSTLGFNDNVGFRFGTCYPWRLYDLQVEEELPIVEVPLIIQDGALLNPAKGMRLDEDTAFQYVKQITKVVERVGGVLTLLWHPNAVMNPPCWNLYLRSLEYLKEKNAWFGAVRVVAVGGKQCWCKGLDKA
ncbi:MAG: polysaccharide deacetylase family protein [Desulfobacterales bacterium]|nr:polysaccharide deacetylase family protein [Desulfobacterales bacterium]